MFLTLAISKPVLLKRKSILTVLFIVASFLLNAQQTDTLLELPVDTAATYIPGEVTDTVVVDMDDEDDDYDYDEDGEDEEKEEDKNYFLTKEITDHWNDSFRLRQLPDSLLKAFRNDKDFWYANFVFQKDKIDKEDSPKSSRPYDLSWLYPLVWIIIVGSFLGFLAILLTNSNVRLFRRSKIISKDPENDEMETDDIFAINYQKEIDRAVNAGNFRLAVRFMFLRLLRDLADKNVIQYTQDKTNFDYLLQLHNTSWYPGFFRIVRNYEFTWYGHFEVDKDMFNVIKSDFDGFDKQLNRN